MGCAPWISSSDPVRREDASGPGARQLLGNGRLPGPGKATDDDEHGGTVLASVVAREREQFGGIGTEARALGRGGADIAGRKCGHLRPDARTIAGVKWDEASELAVVAHLGIPPDQLVRQVAMPQPGQVHGQESEVGSHVATAEARAELEAVEDLDGFGEADGRAAEVAVPIPDVPVAVALLEERPLPDHPGTDRRAKSSILEAIEEVVDQRRRLGEMLFPQLGDRRRASERRDCIAMLGPGMEATQQRTDFRDGVWREPPSLEQRFHHPVLGQPAHLHRVVDDLAGATDVDAILIGSDRDNFQVQIRAEAPVESEFLLAAETAQLQRREIQEGEANLALDLVGEVTGQEDHGHVGADGPDLTRRMRVGSRLAESGQNGFLRQRPHLQPGGIVSGSPGWSDWPQR